MVSAAAQFQQFALMAHTEQLRLKAGHFTNVSFLTVKGLRAAANPGALVYASTAGTGSAPCLLSSDGTNWKQIASGRTASEPWLPT
jgi:hypothetical protein